MKINLGTRIMFLSLGLLLSFGNSIAKEYYESSNTTYADNCYDCGNPLNPCAFSLELRAGVVPTHWNKRGCIATVGCLGITPTSTTSPITLMTEIPEFKHQFKLPWTVGLHADYNLSEHIAVGLEFNYMHAREKCFSFATPLPVATAPLTVTVSFKNPLKAYSGYLSNRYYFDRCWDSLGFFVGFKVGFEHMRSISAIANGNSPAITGTPIVAAAFTFPCFVAYDRSTVVSGGIHAGFDWCLFNGLSLVFTAEVVGSGAPRTNTVVDIAPGLSALRTRAVLLGNIGSQIHFPVTFGLKYTF